MFLGDSFRQSEAPYSSSPSWKALESNLTSITESEFVPRAQTAPPTQGASDDAAVESLIRHFGEFPLAHPDYSEFYHQQCALQGRKTGLTPPLDGVDTIYDGFLDKSSDPEFARQVAEHIANRQSNTAPSRHGGNGSTFEGVLERPASDPAEMTQFMRAFRQMGGSPEMGVPGRTPASPRPQDLQAPVRGYDEQRALGVAQQVQAGLHHAQVTPELATAEQGLLRGMEAGVCAGLGNHAQSAPNLLQLPKNGLNGSFPYVPGMPAPVPPAAPAMETPMPPGLRQGGGKQRQGGRKGSSGGVTDAYRSAGVDIGSQTFQAAFQAAYQTLVQQQMGAMPPQLAGLHGGAGAMGSGMPQQVPPMYMPWPQNLVAQAAAAAAAVVANPQAMGITAQSRPEPGPPVQQKSHAHTSKHSKGVGGAAGAEGRADHDGHHGLGSSRFAEGSEREREDRAGPRERAGGSWAGKERRGSGRGGRSDRDADERDNGRENARDKHPHKDRHRDRQHQEHLDAEAAHSARWRTPEELRGHVLEVAQDQHGCRWLQKKLEEGQGFIAPIFDEISDNVTQLMMDPFGNYLVQKLLDVCNAQQRIRLLEKAAEGDLVKVASNTHGTRAVQKLIETLNGREEASIITGVLKPAVVELVKDLNGNHVVQRWLQKLDAEDSQFIYDAVCANCTGIAMHRHGCCVLQRCIDFANMPQKQRLIDSISTNALRLSRDPFGNYVVQYVLDLGNRDASLNIVTQLQGHFGELSKQKFSSNVVEKCLKQPCVGLEEMRNNIVRELIDSKELPELLSCMFGNYVIQSALQVTTGGVHQQLVDAIRPHLAQIRNTPQGKRIMHKVNGKM